MNLFVFLANSLVLPAHCEMQLLCVKLLAVFKNNKKRICSSLQAAMIAGWIHSGDRKIFRVLCVLGL